MNRNVSYKGKTLEHMNKEELKRQYRVNRSRLKIRITFFIAILVLSFFVCPFVLPIIGAISAVTTFWLLQNNKVIQIELNKRR